MQITEPVTMLTDFALAAAAVSTVNDFMRRTARTRQNPSKSTKPAVVDPTGAPPDTTAATRGPNLVKQQTPLPEDVRQRIDSPSPLEGFHLSELDYPAPQKEKPSGEVMSGRMRRPTVT